MVELIYDEGCPNVAEARKRLLRAFARAGFPPHWVEWLRSDPGCPPHARHFASPTVLVGGRDVEEETQAVEDASCRIYRVGSGRIEGVPSENVIARALQRHERCTSGEKDWVARRGTALLFWGVPWISFALGFIASAGVRPILWTASLLVMGAACVVNATRCGRVHCYFTGPFFLLAALVVLLQGVGVLPLGEESWKAIGLGVIAGAVLLHYGTERLCGRFFAGARRGALDG